MRNKMGQVGSVLKWVLAALALAAIVVIALFWYVRANPLAVYESTTRRSLAKSGLEVKSFESTAGSLAYWEAGEGPALVLLHGVGDQAGAFQGIVDSLLADYRVLIPDLPGHGDSEPEEGPLPMGIVYGGLEELLAVTLDDQPAILVGSSMGAWLATIHAHRHPEAVARAVLINGGALAGDRPDLSLTPVDREAARTLMTALRDPSSPPTPDFVLDDIVEQASKGPIGRMTAELDDLVAHLLDGRLHEVTVPVDLLWGESDQLMTLAYAERMAGQLPRSRLTTIPGCGHHPANECPAKLAARLGEVLRTEPPPPTLTGPIEELMEEAGAEGVP
ncbi:MAG: alpha/beta hydrolase [bacterium]|nr:alpha/beta hydrolase [bacterium]